MRVLAAQNRVNLDDFTLEIQGFQVVRRRQKVHGTRQTHCRMTPVAVGKNTELTARDKLL